LGKSPLNWRILLSWVKENSPPVYQGGLFSKLRKGGGVKIGYIGSSKAIIYYLG
jgi:hypothetical protein